MILAEDCFTTLEVQVEEIYYSIYKLIAVLEINIGYFEQ